MPKLIAIDSHISSKTDPRSVVTSAAYLLFYRRRSEHPLGGPNLQEMLESRKNAVAESEPPQDSRDSSPVTGEGRRLGDSSHNGLSSAFTVVQGHRVGAGGSAMEGENQQSQGLLAETESPPRLMGSVANSEALPGYHDAAGEDEGIGGMDYRWEQDSWGFSRLPPSQRAPAPSEEEGMFGDKGSSNDSTRVEGNEGSPGRSLAELDDTDPIVYSDDFGSRNMRESAPPPELPGMGIPNDDEDDPPVMELQADPTHDGELTFTQAGR